MAKRKKWAAVVLLAALPVALGWVVRERASWQPRTLSADVVTEDSDHSTHSLAWSPDGKRLAVETRDLDSGDQISHLQLWDVPNSTLLYQKKSPASEVVFSPDSLSLAASVDGEVALIETVTGLVKHTVRGSEPFFFTNNGHLIVNEGDDYEGHGYSSWSEYVLGAREGSSSDRRVRRVRQGRKLLGKFVLEKSGAPPALDARHLALRNRGYSHGGASGPKLAQMGSIQIFDINSGRLKSTWKHTLWADDVPLESSPDGRRLLSVSQTTDDIHVWDIQSGQMLCSWKTHGNLMGQYGLVTWAPDGEVIAASEDKSDVIALRDARTGRILRELKGHAYMVNGLAFSPDGATLATSSNDGTVKLWRIK